MDATPGETPHAPAAERRDAYPAVLLCFALSGFAALLYQTAWLRQFSLVFGTSELAVATVLAAYMAGLALGAAAMARFVGRVRRPVLAYGLLELGVALGALAVPHALDLAHGLLASTIGGQAELPDSGTAAQSLFFLACAFPILVVPTAFMGATLPLLTRHAVHRDEQVGRRTGALYAINTAGAVLGTLVAAFVLLPRLGLSGTVQFGVGVNALVFLVAAGVAVRAPSRVGDGAGPRVAHEAPPEPLPLLVRAVLPIMLVSGAVSFTYEVLWTRLLSHLLGGSVYAFATMLASFLLGITLGSAAAARLARDRRSAAAGLSLAQLGTALLSAGIFLALDGLAGKAVDWEAGEAAGLGANALVAGAVLLPAALCIGATFPFALRVLARDERDAAAASARVYAWNTCGAILGAPLAGFFVVPSFGYEGTIRVAVLTNVALAMCAAFALAPRARKVIVALQVLGIGLAFTFRPGAPERLMRSSPFRELPADGELVFSAVGRSASVVVLEQDAGFVVRCNGLPEAEIARAGAPPFGRHSARWLATLPALARPDARSMMVVGFGGGVTLEAVPPAFEHVVSVELEPEVIAANRAIAGRRAADPLADPRLRVVLNDARGALALTDERWDVIVSQPSHPWTAGASHLYTREFVAQAKSHLNEGGVFVQWMHAAFLDEPLLKTLGATLLDGFEHVRLYRPIPFMLIFLASDAPLDVEEQLARTGEPLASAPAEFAALGVRGVNDVLAMLALEQGALEELCAGAPVSTDDVNRMAMQASKALRSRLASDGLDRLLLEHDPVADPDGALATALGEAVDRPYLVRRLFHLGQIGRAVNLVNVTPDRYTKLLGRATFETEAGDVAGARQRLEEAIALAPTDQRAPYLLVQPQLVYVASGQADPGLVRVAQAFEGAAAAVVEAWGALLAGDLEALRALEPRLAAAPDRSPEWVDATRLRALWRCSLPGPDLRERAREALRLIDELLALQPDPQALQVRYAAAGAADDPAAALETANELTLFLGPRAGSTTPYVQQMLRQTLADTLPGLEKLAEDERVEAARVKAVVGKVRAALGMGQG